MLRATYSHQYEPRSTEGGFFPFVDVVVEGDIYTSFGTELFSYGNLRDVTTFNVTDEVSFSTGIHNLETLCQTSRRDGIQVVLSGVNEDVHQTLTRAGFPELLGSENICSHINIALDRANELVVEKE